jgi:hypothetical protein
MNGVKKFLESFYYTTWLYGKLRSYVQPWISTEPNFDEIIPGLYVGDIASAYNKNALKKTGITHVVTAVLGISPIFPKEFQYENFPLRDITNQNIEYCFERSNKYISKAIRNNGKVLVHCLCGVSRSSTLVAAFLMYEFGLTCEDAIKLLQSKRACVQPNDGFKVQLRNFENQLQHRNILDTLTHCIDTNTGKWKQRRRTI